MEGAIGNRQLAIGNIQHGNFTPGHPLRNPDVTQITKRQHHCDYRPCARYWCKHRNLQRGKRSVVPPLPFPNSDSLMAVFESDQQRGQMRGSYSFPNYFDLRDQNNSFEN